MKEDRRPDGEGDHHENERQEPVDALDEREGIPAQPIGEHPPEPDPERRPDGVIEKEACPMHFERAGADAVELAENEKEPGEDDDVLAIAIEIGFDIFQPLAGDADPPAIADKEAMP